MTRRLHLVPRPADYEHRTDCDDCPCDPDMWIEDGVVVVRHREVGG